MNDMDNRKNEDGLLSQDSTQQQNSSVDQVNTSYETPNFVMMDSDQREEKVVESTVIENSNEKEPYLNSQDVNQEEIRNQFFPDTTVNATVSNEEDKNKNKKQKTGKGKRFLKNTVALVSAAALFGAVAGVAFNGVPIGGKNEGAIGMKPIDEITGVTETSSGDSTNGDIVQTGLTEVSATDVSGVVENVMPAIVAINCSATQTQYDFFGREFNQEISGSGSGIIIGQNNKEILIATNNHVVADATAIEIVFNDDSKATGTIKGTEPSSDLAVVAVNIDDLSAETKANIKVATLGNSDNIKTGEMAIAIGNALGYGQSVTVGYISALNREVTVDDVTLNLIQTDAAINPGNSGGALINAKGEVIGINSVKYSDTNVERIGYSIPISHAIPIINDLMNREELKENQMAYLGISGKNVEKSYAEAFNMPVGVYIYKVSEGSAAQKAGLHQGDIITAFNGREVSDMNQLMSILSYTRGGTDAKLTVSVLENGKYVEKEIPVTLGFRTDSSKK
ncbi:S1C family serine protease [Lachnoclostridium phytofermentans]|uniref:Peptidase S1 and S6 chymotrypsin/Hap n=1 Tax=Lachnoclostridium phytofermentans (strain ATCC 700394 / DSM 18823 / ISDg) TaxID=357809 RepID=A9KP61_LACP7|nr:trypsin-like peptidase domain-containing protein [Lachnoclostridium phytofermentans]ABX41723.1 peptidase S1 and S6 chymotrypsin/Hap [Lachnoclostridium phytofermentans ISDg]